MDSTIKVFIGYDSKQDYSDKLNYRLNAPYQVCKKSLLDNSEDIQIIPLKLCSLRELGLYYRTEDTSATTEFTYSRFLVPFLSDYKGISIFCDSDFLWRCNVQDLKEYFTDNYSVLCAQHDYIPKAEVKMDGLKQTVYPRKNWSSLMVFNCEHPDCKNLSVENVNKQSPKFLHRMEWAEESNIGSIPLEYNWLEGEYDSSVNPLAIHYTNGGPWHSTWDGDYKDNWLNIFNKL